MDFPTSTHVQMTAPGIGMTTGQMGVLYGIYDKAVLAKKIKPLPNHFAYPRDTYKYLLNESNYRPPIIIAFMQSLIEYANTRNTEAWKNPLYREERVDTIEKRGKENEEKIISILTKPIDVISKMIGKAGKNITDPITKPLIAGAVIVGVGGVIYVSAKAGLFKGIMKSIKKKGK